MLYEEEVRDLFSVPEEYYLSHCISSDFGMDHDKYERHRIGGDCILEGRVLNLITKERYFHKPTIITMNIALQKMRDLCIANDITKIVMPTIGAGLDRLPWKQVSDLIQHVFCDMDVEILVCKLK